MTVTIKEQTFRRSLTNALLKVVYARSDITWKFSHLFWLYVPRTVDMDSKPVSREG
jgi:hypothetical protein